MREEKFYKPVGEWFLENKGCRQEFTQGYLNRTWVEVFEPDVFALRYELRPQQTKVFDFHGYMAEVKLKEFNDAWEALGKLLRIIRGPRDFSLRNFNGGIHFAYFYIAFPTDQPSEELQDECRRNKIGLLRLEETDGRIFIYEVLKAEQIRANGMSTSTQRSPGTFLDAVNEKGHLKKIIKEPGKLWDKYIKPDYEYWRKDRVL